MWGFGACRGDGCECHNGGVPFCGMGRQHLFGGRLPPLFVSRVLGVAGAEVSEVGPLIGAYAFELGEKRLEVAGGCGDDAHAAGEGFAVVVAAGWSLVGGFWCAVAEVVAGGGAFAVVRACPASTVCIGSGR